MISAKMNLHSITSRGEELMTLEVVMPRYILAEFNTHRVKGKNSASSRAIPLLKMINTVRERTFIPVAWQLEHTGMQGTVYLDKTKKYDLVTFISAMITTLNTLKPDSKEYIKTDKHIQESIKLIDECLSEYKYMVKTLDEWWLLARDKAIEMASIFYVFNVTKQIANRLLEPFMYHKVLVSSTEWKNFFNLRCPQYTFHNDDSENDFVFKSRKEAIKSLGADNPVEFPTGNVPLGELTDLQWLGVNTGQADIHMMFLAEAIYDAIKESTPTKLADGEWHIPFSNDMDFDTLATNYGTEEATNMMCKISIARCARLSYQTLGDNPVIDYEKDLALYENLSTSGHWSPFEHVAKAMSEKEYHITYGTKAENAKGNGWCRNYKGYIQYRELLDVVQ